MQFRSAIALLAAVRRAALGRSRRTLLSAVALVAGVVAAGAAGVVALGGANAEPVQQDAATTAQLAVQRLSVPSGYDDVRLKRDRFTAVDLGTGSDDGGGGVAAPPLGPVVPAGVAQEYAAKQVAARGWKKTEFSCLVALWGRESGWNTHAANPNGAYGIPQAFPGSKMGAGGGDWRNDHRVQVQWGLGYISGRYGTPCGAWGHFQSAGSY